jgi:hypothetical protein
MNENKDINLIAIKSLIECIDNRDIAEGGIFLDDDNAEFVADILRYHYKSLTSKNKMGEVAKIFEKKLGEEFKIIHMSVTNTVKFTADGLEMYYGLSKKWIISSGLLEALLTGEAVITNE